jgi:3-deoxy-7-phosphoheptulonate synthase
MNAVPSTVDEIERIRAVAGSAVHRPDWPIGALAMAVADLARRPPLVAGHECDLLRKRLAAVARGEAFLLQGGDCAETLDGVSADRVHRQLETMFTMADVLAEAVAVPVVTVGRIAGQYAKPRSRPTEMRDGVELPTYRGDAVNDRRFAPDARAADPWRLGRVHGASAATLDLIRSFLRGRHHDGHPREFYASHEALLLDYELALTQRDPHSGRLHALSGHLVWIGERTRRSDGPHVEFAAAIENPVAVKLGPSSTPDDALRLIDRLDPDREPGRLSFITRMGADRIGALLPPLVEKVTASGTRVAWICDPMHGNTFETPNGRKTRRFDDVFDEIRRFFEVHRALGSHPGGIHLELTGDDVTECLGGSSGIGLDDLGRRYESACDPRLNRRQSLDLAQRVARIARDG